MVQQEKTSVYETEERGFESLRAHMMISELIPKLQVLLETYGDLEVHSYPDDMPLTHSPRLTVEEAQRSSYGATLPVSRYGTRDDRPDPKWVLFI